MEIDGTFSFNNSVQPVELISDQTLFAENVDNIVRVSGWGWTIEGQPSIANDLQAVDVPIISNQQADQQLDVTFPNHPQLTDRMISTDAESANREGECHGDSGGPLVFQQNNQNDIQIGVVSWGVPTCVGGDNSPSIYARISELTDWINAQVWDYARISGSNLVCSNFNRIFSLHNVPWFMEVDWTSSSNVQIVSGTTSSVTIRASNNSINGEGWIRATLSNGVELTKEFWVGKPGYSGSTIVNDTRSSSNYVYTYSNALGFYVSIASGVDSYHWTITSEQSCGSNYSGPKFYSNGNGTQATTTSNLINVNSGTCSGYFWIQCNATNNCGDTYYSSRKFRVTNSTGGGGCTYSVSTYPNPAKGKGDVTVNLILPPPGCDSAVSSFSSIENVSESLAGDEIASIMIIDNSGNTICTETCTGISKVIQTDGLDRGIYYVNVQTKQGRIFQSRIVKN